MRPMTTLAATAPSALLGLAAAVAVAGLVAAAFALRRRTLAEPRCPRCGYAMRGGDLGGACPECGFRSADRDAWYRGGRRWWLALAAIGVAGLALGLPWAIFGKDGTLVGLLGQWRTLAVGSPAPGWRVSIEESRDPVRPWRRLRVERDGETVWSVEGWYLSAGVGAAPFELGAPGSHGFGGDLEGDGIADLVVSEVSAGTGGFARTHVLALGVTGGFVPLGSFPGVLRDVDGDGIPWEAVAPDPCLDYRWTSGAGSPRLAVILTAHASSDFGIWRVSARHMRKPAPPESDLAERARSIREVHAREGIGPPEERQSRREEWLSPLVGTMGELVYSGHRERAFRFLDEAWPGDEAEREAFRLEFTEALAESPYAVEIEALSRPARPDGLTGSP